MVKNNINKDEQDADENKQMGSEDIMGPRSRSSSPSNFQKVPFQKESSPFLKSKSLLKPVPKKATEIKKPGLAIPPQIQKATLKPLKSPLAFQSSHRKYTLVKYVYLDVSET